MKYLLLICRDESEPLSEEDNAAIPAAAMGWVTKFDANGVRVRGDRLRPTSDATTVRVRDAEVLLSDGPFAETKEQIAGYDIVECTDLDHAIQVASEHPVARVGTIEIRPFWDQ